ncbi:MAG: peptide ABC transporter permease [Gammaproteobacteria bacterium]|nr:MAG: peptide ABC transporter permease [Gammaproteobacteria bacterium]
MPFTAVFLWTDILIYLLLVVGFLAVFYIRKYPHLRKPWAYVFKRKRGVISVSILLVYIVIGSLDSIHFRLALPVDKVTGSQHYSTEVLTLLDLSILPLRDQVEKTYSSPFATTLFVREMQVSSTGKTDYIYPKLRYAGSHLNSEQEKKSDIIATLFQYITYAVMTWLLLMAMIFMAWSLTKKIKIRQLLKQLYEGESDYPLKTLFSLILVILITFFTCLGLSIDYHILGTDKVGQDVFYQALKSVRTGLVIGSVTTLVMLPFALFLGITAGYFKGWIDDVIQYIYTTLNSIPGVLLIAAAVLMMQVYMDNHPDSFSTIAERADVRLLFLCIILGLTSWTGLCRILRGETLKLREADYVLAARSLGVGNLTILHRHILPNLMHIVMISVVLDFSGLVLAEAVLSYIGVGVDPSMISWGNMINSARLEMAREPIVWWSLAAAFVSMFVLVLAANLFADVVRDAFDPKTDKAADESLTHANA